MFKEYDFETNILLIREFTELVLSVYLLFFVIDICIGIALIKSVKMSIIVDCILLSCFCIMFKNLQDCLGVDHKYFKVTPKVFIYNFKSMNFKYTSKCNSEFNFKSNNN